MLLISSNRSRHIMVFTLFLLSGTLLIVFSTNNLTHFLTPNNIISEYLFKISTYVSIIFGILLFGVGLIGIIPRNIPKEIFDKNLETGV